MSVVGNLIAMKEFTFGTDKTWASVATITTAEQTVNAPGVLAGDLVLVQAPTHQAGLAWSPMARVATDGVLTIKFINPTAGGITPTALLAWKGVVLKFENSLSASASV